MGNIIENKTVQIDTRVATQLSHHSGPALLTPEEITSKPCFLIPKKYLWGIQPKNEYRKKDEKSVKEALMLYGKSFLFEHPAVAVEIQLSEGVGIFLMDGHHRLRYSGERSVQTSSGATIIPGIDPVPCAILTPTEGVIVENRRRKKHNSPLLPDEQSFIRWIIDSSQQAAASFTRIVSLKNDPSKTKTVEYYHAELIPNLNAPGQLATLFPSFTPNVYPKTAIA